MPYCRINSLVWVVQPQLLQLLQAQLLDSGDALMKEVVSEEDPPCHLQGEASRKHDDNMDMDGFQHLIICKTQRQIDPKSVPAATPPGFPADTIWLIRGWALDSSTAN